MAHSKSLAVALRGLHEPAPANQRSWPRRASGPAGRRHHPSAPQFRTTTSTGERTLATVLLAVLQPLREDEQPSDAALMEQLIRKEPAALERLYDRYSRAIYSLVLRIAQQAASAEEIVQNVFLQLWRNAHLYQPSRGPLEPWLFTLARNRALDHMRS